MGSTLSSDRQSTAVRATLDFDTAPEATYEPDMQRIVVTAGTVSVRLSPGAERAFVDSLMGAVDAAEGHWEPDKAALAPGHRNEGPR